MKVAIFAGASEGVESFCNESPVIVLGRRVIPPVDVLASVAQASPRTSTIDQDQEDCPGVVQLLPSPRKPRQSARCPATARRGSCASTSCAASAATWSETGRDARRSKPRGRGCYPLPEAGNVDDDTPDGDNYPHYRCRGTITSTIEEGRRGRFERGRRITRI